jgi:hypothetical protein
MVKRYAWFVPVLAALLLPLAACSSPRTVETYHKNGLRFSYPSSWMVTTDMRLPGNERVREVVVSGPDHSLLLLFCFPEATNVNLESFAASAAKGRAGVVKKNLDGAPFTARAVTARIAGQEAPGIEQAFDLEILGQTLPHRASYYLVHVPGFKVLVGAQAAQQHLAAVQPSWQKVFDTLALEAPVETPANSGGLKAIFVR